MNARIRVGTRTSRLAMVQTEMVIDNLVTIYPNLEIEVVQISSDGDKYPNTPLSELNPGIFTKTLERALINGQIDIAIHSLKDLPTIGVPGITTIPVLQRGDHRDVLITKWEHLAFMDLPNESTVGTSSPRREAQLRAGRPDLIYQPIRGNVETRIGKVKDTAHNSGFDSIILAASGVIRLGLESNISEFFSPSACMPAPGQGALAVQLATENNKLLEVITSLIDASTAAAVEAERTVLSLADAGCQMPIGAFATVQMDVLVLAAVVTAPDGSWTHRVEISGPASEPQIVGRAAYEALLEQGSGDILSKGKPA
jgi:hydroxymethylbilane synthase